jgi:hypothetical protein
MKSRLATALNALPTTSCTRTLTSSSGNCTDSEMRSLSSGFENAYRLSLVNCSMRPRLFVDLRRPNVMDVAGWRNDNASVSACIVAAVVGARPAARGRCVRCRGEECCDVRCRIARDTYCARVSFATRRNMSSSSSGEGNERQATPVRATVHRLTCAVNVSGPSVESPRVGR